MSRVTELLGPEISKLPAGPVRARAHLLLGEDADLAGHEEHLERALANSGNDPALRATALATKSMLLALVRVERISEAETLAVEAHRLAQSGGAEAARHARQALTWARILLGHPVEDLTKPVPGVAGTSSLYEISIDRPAAVQLAFGGRIAEARALLRRLFAQAEEHGETRFGAVLTLHLCELELRAGELREASRLLDEWAESGATEGMEPTHARCCALLASLRGLPNEMERWAAAVPQSVDGYLWDRWDELEVVRARGIAALFAHEPERAGDALGRVWEHTLREGVADPGAFPVAADLVEALVWLGRTAEADAVTGRLRELAERQEHRWALVTVSRCAAMARLASGYNERAAGQLADAAARYGELGLRFDRARSLLWLGQAARRARKRTAARRALETASKAFDALGSPGWAGQAEAELDLLGARRPASAGDLTAAERRVVDLAASGLSNKQIARRLFVAVHTVEVHLAHAYAKLGVRSRAQLASRLASPASPPDTTSAPPQDTN